MVIKDCPVKPDNDTGVILDYGISVILDYGISVILDYGISVIPGLDPGIFLYNY